MDWLEEVNTEEERVNQIFSFDEYMDITGAIKAATEPKK